MESLEVAAFGGVYRDRPVLVTGHTGFKGSWLALWLETLGARVTGLALPSGSSPSHWDLLDLEIDDRRIDIRDAAAVREAVDSARPEIVFHLAAQSLVRRSYRDPLETWSTNVVGTAAVLDACRRAPAVRAVVVVTSDKCYENRESEVAHREEDRLGGHDPYSASKAAVELVASSYRDAFLGGEGAPQIATARGGNVVGGGDWSEDRLIPDLARAIANHSVLEIRSPDAVRPWQHVLECLSGYLRLGQKLVEGAGEFAEAWNFGPEAESHCSVAEVLSRLKGSWPDLDWRLTGESQPRETRLLRLDSGKARRRLGWHSVWSLEKSLAATAEWYRAQMERDSVISRDQLKHYTSMARQAGLEWAGS